MKYIYYKCNTEEEFFYRIQQFTKGTYKNYTVLYLAFHGRTNRIEVEHRLITLKEIATAVGGKLARKIVLHSLYSLYILQINIFSLAKNFYVN
ncbi:DUF6642 family protein [Dysgonomonas termitidis]|uniref:DUF6642 family protein n=1 Tax=Dysgonomonas termitidis TaxID=1516126 RepID=A0ABV9KPY5_9BACT